MTTFHPGQPIVVGNWKQNTTLEEAVDLARQIAQTPVTGVQVAVCPPSIWLASVFQAISGSSIRLGAQDISAHPNGAYTGEVSATMVAEVCAFTLVGHSERRRLFTETDDVVAIKLRAALSSGLGVVLCVGETAEQRDAGEAEVVVTRQLLRCLDGLDPATADLVIAYEPVWAIGTGRSATAGDARAMTASIADVLSGRLGLTQVPVLYGGSVTSGNAVELATGDHVAGFLVGGASLKADEFTAICRAVAPDD